MQSIGGLSAHDSVKLVFSESSLNDKKRFALTDYMVKSIFRNSMGKGQVGLKYLITDLLKSTYLQELLLAFFKRHVSFTDWSRF